MKKLLFFVALLCACATASAQDLRKITLKGIISDTSGADMPFATVMLLNPVDSNLVNFTRADDKGAFVFKNVKNTAYLIKSSYVGYIPFQQHIPASTTEVNDLGILRMKLINTELNEVVIKAARSTLSFKGDTIEYDAASFKVPPGSTVEDLLRRLPGIEVDADGNIKAQGRDVQRLYVDGKTFFSDDPKAATKNLGAETISKVQVYDEKSEQTQLTGVDDGKKTKTMNLELKDEFKKGAFGKVTAGVGTEGRWAGRGNYNRFNKKEQLSFIGYGNNINQTGINWDDYGEFKGQNTWGNRDNVDFGFGNGGGRYYMMDDRDVPMNYNDGRGFSENYGAGANYNFDNKKTKANLSYFYNQTDLDLDQFGFRQTFTGSSSFTNTDTMNRTDFKNNHNISGRFEHDIDSNNTIIINARTRFTGNENQNLQTQLFQENQRLLDINNRSFMDNLTMSGSAIYRHKFRKKGRSFAVSAALNHTQNDGEDQFASLNSSLLNPADLRRIRQQNLKTGTTNSVRSSLLYTEPLSKKWYWETFYNFAKSSNIDDRQTSNPDDENKRIDSLSLWFDNRIDYNRIGSSLRYMNNGLNVSVGVAGQQLRIGGKYAVDENAPLLADPFSRDFTNIIPYVDANYEFDNNAWLNTSYSYSVREPQMNDLRPVPNVSNPLFRSDGNPNLRPTRAHEIGVSYGFWNSANLSNLNVGVDFSLFDDNIAYSQIIEFIDSLGVRTTSRPENVSGAYELSSYLWYGFPIVKTKLTLNLGGNVNLNKTPAFINGERNETTRNSFGFRPNFNFTPNPDLILTAGGGIDVAFTNYSIQQEQNQDIYTYSSNVSMKWQMIAKTFFEGNFTYSRYENRSQNFSRSVPIINASVRRLVGKANKVEVRLAAFDLLNRRVTVNQFASQNFTSNSVTNTLARYFMLSVSYNVRGYESKLKKNEWW